MSNLVYDDDVYLHICMGFKTPSVCCYTKHINNINLIISILTCLRRRIYVNEAHMRFNITIIVYAKFVCFALEKDKISHARFTYQYEKLYRHG